MLKLEGGKSTSRTKNAKFFAIQEAFAEASKGSTSAFLSLSPSQPIFSRDLHDWLFFFLIKTARPSLK